MKDAKFTGGQTCQVSFLSSWEKEMNQKSRFHPADCDLRSALQASLRAARVWRQGVGVEKVGRWEEEKLLTLKCSNLSHEMHTESPKPSA